MKKLLALTLTMAMLFTMTAMAEDKITTNQGTASTDVKATYVAGSPDTTIYSVNISWGSMDFTYTDGSKGTWNPQTHSYDDGTDGKCPATGNTITDTNHTNAAVSATISFKSDITTLTPIFDNEVLELATADGTNVGSAPTATSTLTLDGSIDPSDIVDGKIGMVTVTIDGNETLEESNNNLAVHISNISTSNSEVTSDRDLIVTINGNNITEDIIKENGALTLVCAKGNINIDLTSEHVTTIVSEVEAIITVKRDYFKSRLEGPSGAPFYITKIDFAINNSSIKSTDVNIYVQ